VFPRPRLILLLVAGLTFPACDRKSPVPQAASSSAQVTAEAFPPPDPAMVAEGEKVFAARQCAACHTIDGSPGMGPTLAGIYGKKQALADGREVVVDIPYLRRSLIDPKADLVNGYGAAMLNYKDLMSERDIASVIAYIRTLKPEEDAAPGEAGNAGEPGAGH
jgi:cytochrome c oxidase subunit II